jgi:HlyD family secretion protein/epimerase transport system membrane fusion protein
MATENNQQAPDKSDQNRWSVSAPAPLLRTSVIAGLVVVALFFGGLGIWAATAPIAGAAIAPGVVSPDGSRKTVQHLEGGIIQKILVEDGDEVREGDTLIVLQDTQARASFEVLEGERRLLAAKLARLLSEQANHQEIRFPGWLAGSEKEDTELKAILDAQRDLFSARLELHSGRKAIGQKRIDELMEEINGLELQIESQRKQIDLLDEEINAKKKLVERGMLARPEFLGLQRLRAEVEGELAENLAGVARARQSIGETELQIVNQDAVRLDEIVNELAETRSALSSIEEKLQAQKDVLERTVVIAPVAGTIVQSRFYTTGGVVGPGQPILDIVPAETELLIDARVRPVDIDSVAPGQSAQVHFLAFSQRRVRQIQGTVRSISADSLLDEHSGQSYFLARVEVSPEELEKLGEDAKISPGMPAEVLIKTGERTALQYIVEPLVNSLRRSFRES